MILAYKSGTLIAVRLVEVRSNTVVVKDYDNKLYIYKVSDSNRKLFSGNNAVPDAIQWIEQERDITLNLL